MEFCLDTSTWQFWVILVITLLYLKGLPFAYTLRTGYIIVSTLWKPKITDFKKGFQQKYIAAFDDLDFNIHMNNASYYKHCDWSRIEFLLRSGLYMVAYKRGWYLANAGVSLSFRRQIDPFQKFVLQTRIKSWDDKWIYFEHKFLSEKAVVHAIGYAKFVCKKPNRENVPPIELWKLVKSDLEELHNEVSHQTVRSKFAECIGNLEAVWDQHQ